MKGPLVAELRPSQLLYTYGVGAVVDLPHLAVLVSGLNDWQRATLSEVREDRLLAAVRRRLGDEVRDLVRMPAAPDEPTSSFGPDRDGPAVPVVTFPRWLRCPNCDLLAPVDDGLFKFRENYRNPGESRYVHEGCLRARSRPGPAIPARFLLACDHGHLDDFPWRWFAHQGPTQCSEQLRLIEQGITGEASDLVVECDCGAKRSLAAAFEENANLPACRGRRPHLRDVDPDGCTSQMVRPILLGATNSWFPVTMSSLALPRTGEDELSRRIEQYWEDLGAVEDAAELNFLRRRGSIPDLEGYDNLRVFDAIVARRSSTADAQNRDLKRAEWEAMIDPTGLEPTDDFKLERTEVPGSARRYLNDVVLVERLREVTALLGFTRIRSPLDAEELDGDEQERWAPLTSDKPSFLPAAEVRGEGIFLRFDEDHLERWVAEHRELETPMRASHDAWREARGLSVDPHTFPGLRYVLLHSFSHALMRTLALECGYAAASIRERIYAAPPTNEEPMAGILLYTAAPDAEGTLGGLAHLGQAKQLEGHLRRALDDLALCSSDPLCAHHLPDPDGSTLHGAACHACLFAPETSCERSNRYLDRRALVDVLGTHGEAFLSGR